MTADDVRFNLRRAVGRLQTAEAALLARVSDLRSRRLRGWISTDAPLFIRDSPLHSRRFVDARVHDYRKLRDRVALPAMRPAFLPNVVVLQFVHPEMRSLQAAEVVGGRIGIV
jgi:hypothetical protein